MRHHDRRRGRGARAEQPQPRVVLGEPRGHGRVAQAGNWFHTGDGGTFEDGYVTIADRKKDVIITGGENVSSIEVEDALMLAPRRPRGRRHRHPRREVGRARHRAGGARRGPGRRPQEDLIAHCREHLAGYKCPKRVEFRDELDPHGHRQAAEVQAARGVLGGSRPPGELNRRPPARARPDATARPVAIGTTPPRMQVMSSETGLALLAMTISLVSVLVAGFFSMRAARTSHQLTMERERRVEEQSALKAAATRLRAAGPVRRRAAVAHLQHRPDRVGGARQALREPRRLHHGQHRVLVRALLRLDRGSSPGRALLQRRRRPRRCRPGTDHRREADAARQCRQRRIHVLLRGAASHRRDDVLVGAHHGRRGARASRHGVCHVLHPVS